MSINKNLLSFIIPTYKGEATLEKLVKDLFSYFKNYIEIIIVNDCSLIIHMSYVKN